MGLPAYIALGWDVPDADATADARALAERLISERPWPVIWRSACSLVLSDAPEARIHRLPNDGGVLLGDFWPARAGRFAFPRGREGPPLARALVQSGWGRYVAVLEPTGASSATLLRDPSGQIGALLWRARGRVAVAASDLSVAPPWLWPAQLRIDREQLGRFLADPAAGINTSLFSEVTSLLPGEACAFSGHGAQRERVWGPADHVKPTDADPLQTAQELVRRVDQSVEALAINSGSCILELSGGLDSAIVAGALSALGQTDRVKQWLNSFSDRPEGDERRYAQAVTDRLGVPLTTVAKSLAPLREADLAELADSSWPAINGCDASRDRDAVERLQSTGARSILSGQGGDAVFFQMPSALILGEALDVLGPGCLLSPKLPNVARRLQTSVWSVLAALRAERRQKQPLASPASPLATAEARALRAGCVHPWVADAFGRGLGGAKQLQISGLATAQMLHGSSRRNRLADLSYPLLSQPVLEWCLAIPSFVLADGAFDRPYARRVFAHRLPEAIRTRRSKGGLNSYHSRLLAGSLEMLRPYLLDGLLCELGVLDRAATDAALNVDTLLWRARPTEIFWAATVESWARGWSGRIGRS